MKYIIVKDNEVYDIEYMEFDIDGYKIKNKNKTITFYNEEMIHSVILSKLDKKINNLYKMIMNVIEEGEDDEGDFMLLLDDVDRLKLLAELQFKKFLKIEEYKMYIDRLYYLENTINDKLTMINIYHNYNYGNSFGGRGR